MSINDEPPPDDREAGITRRRFVTGLGVAAGAAVAAGYGLSVWANGDSSTTSTAGKPLTPPTLGGRDDRTLVVVELGGGNDGLSTVVPMADPAYPALRPTLGITNAIPLDDAVGLHPNLAKLAARFRAGYVAIVEGVGYPEPNLSHFASLSYWWGGAPGESGNVGWLGRYLDGTVGFDRPARGRRHRPLAVAGICSARTRSRRRSPIPRVSSRRFPHGPTRRTISSRRGRSSRPRRRIPRRCSGQVQQAIHLTVKARADLRTDLASDTAGATGPSDELGAAQGGGNYRQSASVTDSLRLAAQLVAAKHPPRVIYVSGLGDYDTHQGQAQRHPLLMADLDEGDRSVLHDARPVEGRRPRADDDGVGVRSPAG